MSNQEHSQAGPRVKTPEEIQLLMAELRRRLEQLYGARLHGVYLFGSYARGEAGIESDLDVLIVLDRIEGYMREVRRTGGIVSELSLEFDVSIAPVFVAEPEWRKSTSAFLRNVRAEGRAAA